MNFVEAMRRSQATGESFHAHGRWFRYWEGWTYRVSVDDILCDDYEMLPKYMDEEDDLIRLGSDFQ